MIEDYLEYICSNCGHETDTSIDSNFICPYCGEEMEIKDE